MNFFYDGVSLQNGRISNMDSLLLRERIIDGHKTLLAVVCDGVGSEVDGAFAASSAVKMMNEWFGALSTIERIGLQMRDEVLFINNRIIEQAHDNSLKTAATLTALLFIAGKFYVVHIGDTRAYSIERNGLITQLTVDDISSSGKLTGCIGRFEDPLLLYTEGDVGDKVFLICSDGLYKRIIITSTIIVPSLNHRRDIKKLINSMVNASIECGERDNITLAIVVPKESASQ